MRFSWIAWGNGALPFLEMSSACRRVFTAISTSARISWRKLERVNNEHLRGRRLATGRASRSAARNNERHNTILHLSQLCNSALFRFLLVRKNTPPPVVTCLALPPPSTQFELGSGFKLARARLRRLLQQKTQCTYTQSVYGDTPPVLGNIVVVPFYLRCRGD